MEIEERIKLISHVKKELNDYSGRLISIGITGSRLYGFSSPNSDYDIMGVFAYQTDRLLSIHKPRDNHYIDFGEKHIVVYEVEKILGLIDAGNCNIIENLLAEQLYSTADFQKIKKLIFFNYDGLYKSYRGLSYHNYKKFILTGKRNEVKKYLYVFRSLMAGIHFLKEGFIQPYLPALITYHQDKLVKSIMKAKKQFGGDTPLPTELDTGEVEDRIDYYFNKIDQVYANTEIPEKLHEGPEYKAMNKFLIKLRRERMNT